MKHKLTDDLLKTLSIPDGKDRLVVFDKELAGFGIVLMRTRATWIVNRRVGARLERQAFGHWGKASEGGLDARSARKKAIVYLGKLENKEPTPNRIKRARSTGPTVAEAVELYLAHLAATGSR